MKIYQIDIVCLQNSKKSLHSESFSLTWIYLFMTLFISCFINSTNNIVQHCFKIVFDKFSKTVTLLYYLLEQDIIDPKFYEQWKNIMPEHVFVLYPDLTRLITFRCFLVMDVTLC
jgi:hypothetical protein